MPLSSHLVAIPAMYIISRVLKDRVDEGGNGRAATYHEQYAQQEQHNDEGGEQKLFTLFKESKQVFESLHGLMSLFRCKTHYI